MERAQRTLDKPGIDLEPIKSLNVSISTQIGNDGSGGNDKGGGEGNTAEDTSVRVHSQ